MAAGWGWRRPSPQRARVNPFEDTPPSPVQALPVLPEPWQGMERVVDEVGPSFLALDHIMPGG